MMVIYKLFNYFKCINKLTIGGIYKYNYNRKSIFINN